MARQPRVACFDLLDTVLFRSVLDPTDVFRIIGLRLKEALPEQMAMMSEDGFVAERRVAELRARKGRPEVTLRDIWDELIWLVGEHRDKAMNIELACERDVLFPNTEICSQIANRRAQGQQIAFVSDMYLPEEFLRSVLEEHGIMQSDDKLFVSSTFEKTKHSGELYQQLMASLGGKPFDYQMIGDHRHSDFRMPRSLGLRSTHYRGHRLSTYERRVNYGLGTSQLTRSVLVGSVRKGRSNHGANADRLVTDFLGPASMIWALWVIRRAEELGVERLFFMSRDAYLPYLCARKIAELGYTKVRTTYLYGSRYSLYFPNVRNLKDDLDWIFQKAGVLTKSKILRYLNLDSEHLSCSMRALCRQFDDAKTLDRPDFDQLITTLEQSKEGATVLESAASMRSITQDYYNQEGLTGPESSAIVDIGWHLNIQAALQRIMPEKRMRGFYLYLSQTRRRPSETGEAEAMLELSVTHSRISTPPSLWHHSTVVEHLFGMAPEGTCRGFRTDESGVVRPILQDMSLEESSAKQQICGRVQHFAQEWLPLYALAFPTAESCAAAFRVLSDEYLRSPTKESLFAVPRSIYLSTEPLNEETSALISKFQLSDVQKAASRVRRRKQGEALGWLGAKFSLAPAPLNFGGEIIHMIRRYLK